MRNHMNKQIILAFLLAIGSTTSAAETEVAPELELTETIEQNINSANLIQETNEKKATITAKIKGGLHKYFIRENKKMTCINICIKTLAVFQFYRSFTFNKNYYNLSSSKKKELINDFIQMQLTTLLFAAHCIDF